jgi:transcriptional regulator with XRE-family HTH domain
MPGAVARTKLAKLRLERGISQEELAAVTGISIATYRRLERGEITNPGVAYLSNCAQALGVELDDVIEESLRTWNALSPQAARPPRSDGSSGPTDTGIDAESFALPIRSLAAR